MFCQYCTNPLHRRLLRANLCYELLNDAETILVHGKVYEVLNDWLEDKVKVLFFKAKKDFLKDVRPVLVEGQIYHMVLHCFF